MTENKENTDYENNPDDNNDDDDSPKLTDETLKMADLLGATFKYFSLSIILFLLMSYFSNNYIAGIGMNFIPLFLPLGKSFFPRPVLGSMFHSNQIPENSNKFFKKMSLECCGEKYTQTYYNLLEMGGSFLGILKGVGYLSDLFKVGPTTEISTAQIFIVDYDKACWYQKLVLVIFGAIQILLGTVTTLFSSFAYLFSGKHGFLLNLPEEKKRMEKKQKYLFKNLGMSMVETKTDQSVLKSGWSKFALFFNFINFIFVDKLTYGTRYFIEDKHSSFMDRLKYFFFILFVIIIIQSLRGSYANNINGLTATIFLIIFLFILFAKRILNPKFSPTYLPNYEGLLHEIQESAKKNDSNNKDYTFNDLEKDMNSLKDTLNKSMKNYYTESEKIAKELKFEKIESKSIQEQIKEKYEKTKEKLKETFKKKENSPETAATNAQQNLDPKESTTTSTSSSQSGGSIRIKEKYKKRIEELRNEINNI